jgi:glycolate oxidase
VINRAGALVRELARIAGEPNVLTSPEAVLPYGRDETEDLCFPPEVVVRPASTQEVSEILKTASREGVPVTPRGAGTGLSGGALPVRGGIVLSLDRMNRIVEIDRGNLMAVVEPGVITQRLQEEAEALGLCYPPDPASRGSCMMGGNVAENAGGPRAVKYGVTRDWVTGLEAVLADGRVFTTGGKLRKDASGYNLTGLLVGSEGTLAVVTRIVVKLIPSPAHRRALLACFGSVQAAAQALGAVFDRGVIPSAAELMEGAAWSTGASWVGRAPMDPGHAAYLLLEADGPRAELVENEAIAMGEACLASEAVDVLVADTPARQADLWRVRRAIGEAVKKIAPYKEEDTVVPRRQVPELLEAVDVAVRRHGLRAICYGHAGDGNIHVNLLKDGSGEWGPGLDSAIREIFTAVGTLGGKISGEHGIGWVQREWLPLTHDPVELSLMRAVKQLFDPRGILNPGKIFPEG